MAGAAIIGAIDYSSAKNSRGFNNLYKEEKPVPAKTHAGKEIESPEKVVRVADVKAEILKAETAGAVKKGKKRKKKISYDKFSRAAIPDELILIDSTLKLKLKP